MASALHADGSGAAHVAGEIAVCMKAAGLVERPDLDQAELRGRELFLDHALEAAVSDGIPAPGQARCLAGIWCCRPAPARALLAGPVRTLDRWRAVVRRAVATTAIEIDVDSLPRAKALSIVGPRAQAVIDAAGLPAGLPAGAVAEGRIGASPLDVLHEEGDRWLLLFGAGCSEEAWHELGEAGRPLGLAHVGQSALDHLGARRTR